MARNKHNNADEDDKPMRFENPCYINNCHHDGRDPKNKNRKTKRFREIIEC